MQTYTHVEDYLELLAGWSLYKQVTNTSVNIALARYDVTVVDSMANHVGFGGALTDRQATLACQLILKYRRQFSLNNIDVSPVETPQYRQPLRLIDRVRRIWLADDRIGMYFPYSKEMITDLYEYKKDSVGSHHYDPDTKSWYFGLTEYNLNWIHEWGILNQFHIDLAITELFRKLLECENTLYEIKLVATDTGYTVTNAAPSLLEYVTTHLGGWGKDNIATLIDNAGILEYTVDNTITTNGLIDQFGLQYEHQLHPTLENLVTVLDYAILSDRFPVVIYHPAASATNGMHLSLISGMFNKEEIIHIDLSGKITTSANDITCAKVIYIEKFPKHPIMDRIPLLITYHALLYGSNKQCWINSADRIVYLCSSMLRV